MSVQSDLVLAPAEAANDILASDAPAEEWQGFTSNGMDDIKMATLLSLLSSRSPNADYDRWLSAMTVFGAENEDGPCVYLLPDAAVGVLAAIAAKEGDEFEELAKSWGATEEFEFSEPEEVREFLRDIGDLAETARLERKAMFLWTSL